MLNEATQDRIGRQLRAIYESIPKGGIPERIWLLLLLIEHDWGHKTMAQGAKLNHEKAGT